MDSLGLRSRYERLDPLTEETILEARRRIGHTAEDHAQWVLDFAHRDFKPLREQDRLNVRLEWAILFEHKLTLRLNTGHLLRGALPKVDAIDQWRRQLAFYLKQLSEGNEVTLRTQADKIWSIQRGVLTLRTETRPILKVDGPIIAALEKLAAVGSKLPRCRNESCRKTFVRVRRQVYYSQRCRETVTKRVYRNRLKGRGARSPLLLSHKPD